MKRSLYRGASSIASALTLTLFVLIIAPAPAAATKLRRLYDFTTVKTSWLMKREAFRVGLRLDRDMDLLLTRNVDVAFATVDGFEQIDLTRDAAMGAEVGFLFLRGHRHVPDGFYVMELVNDPTGASSQGDAYALLIATRGGKEFRFPLRITPAEIGLDPRKSLLVQGGHDLSLGVSQGAQTYSLALDETLDVIPRSLPLAQVGESFIATLTTANGFPPDSFTSTDPLPPGLALSGSSLTGVPTTVGDFSFTIEASDSAGNQGMRNYTLSVLPAGLLILTEALPDALVDASYGAQVLALGGIRPYRWRVDGEIPAGLTFSESGFLNGRPAVAGTFIVTVTVQDQAGDEASANLALTVNSTGLVSLTPSLLPDGLVGAPYDLPLSPSGGIPPYLCELVDGQLPPGLSLSGCVAVSGTPQVPGVFAFTIRVRGSDPKLPLTLLMTRCIRVVTKTQ